MIDDFIAHLKDIDVTSFQALNSYLGNSPYFDRIVGRFDDVTLKGLLFSATFGAVWFQHTKSQARGRELLILMLLAIVLSLVVSRGFADLLPFRQRPMYEPGFHVPLSHYTPYFENWSSLPSDTAAVIFSMATGFWLVSRWLGLFWAAFAVVAMTARVTIGLHYPADVILGALIGICVAIATSCKVMRRHVALPILSIEQRAPSIFYAVLFPVLYEVSAYFNFTRGIFHAFLNLHHGL